MDAKTVLAQSLTLPSGEVLPNRLAKAAMSEGLADHLGQATPELARLSTLGRRRGGPADHRQRAGRRAAPRAARQRDRRGNSLR